MNRISDANGLTAYLFGQQRQQKQQAVAKRIAFAIASTVINIFLQRFIPIKKREKQTLLRLKFLINLGNKSFTKQLIHTSNNTAQRIWFKTRANSTFLMQQTSYIIHCNGTALARTSKIAIKCSNQIVFKIYFIIFDIRQMFVSWTWRVLGTTSHKKFCSFTLFSRLAHLPAQLLNVQSACGRETNRMINVETYSSLKIIWYALLPVSVIWQQTKRAIKNWPHTKEDQTGEEDESDAETQSSLFQWTWKNLCFVWKWEQTYMEIAWSLNVYLSKGYKPLLNTIVVHLKFESLFTYHCTIALRCYCQLRTWVADQQAGYPLYDPVFFNLQKI